MSQNDLVIDNQSFPATRSDINSALQALGSLSSGSSAPATTYANMLWYDTINNTLKMRSEANDQWISVAYVDQSADAFRILDDTQVVNTSGTQTGLLGDQATSAWEAGTGTTESLVSPAKVKAAIDAIRPEVTDKDVPISTVNPAGLSEVVFSSLSEPFYSFYFNGIYPATADTDILLYVYISGDNGVTWTVASDTNTANWRLNGGGSGLLRLNTAVGVGEFALGYKDAITSKSGSLITPTGATLPINAIRVRWWRADGDVLKNFGSDIGQTIIQYAR